MYTKEKCSHGRNKKRKERIWFGKVCAAMLFGAIGIFAFGVMMVTAAPGDFKAKEPAREQKEQESGSGETVSDNETEKDTPLSVKEEQVKEPLIVVDAGHGGVDDGCLGGGMLEKEINLQIAVAVKKRLEERGFRVLMLRETDEYLAKEERVELANSYQADAYISIHQNTYEGSDKSVSGIETWYDGADDTRDNQRLAMLVHQETIRSTGAKERELWGIADFCVTGKTLMPACLIETGFLSNPEEGRKLSTAEYQEKIAEGIAKGVELYFHADTKITV